MTLLWLRTRFEANGKEHEEHQEHEEHKEHGAGLFVFPVFPVFLPHSFLAFNTLLYSTEE
jgi:hypothetical protein